MVLARSGAIVRRAGEDRMGRRRVHLSCTLFDETLGRPHGGSAGVNYVVYHYGASAGHLADNVRDLRLSRLAPELVDDSPRQPQMVCQAFGYLHLPGVWGDDHRVLGIPEALPDKVVHKRVHSGQMVHREAEEAFDLADMQVQDRKSAV